MKHTLMTRFRILGAGIAAMTLLATAGPVAQIVGNDIVLPLRLTAFAVNMSNIGTGANGIVQVRITRWSSAAERQNIINTFLEKGQDQLLRTMEKLPAKGRFNFPNYMGPDPNNLRLGWDIKYTWHTPDPDGGHRIVIAIDRYMSFMEVRNQPRTVDYPFTLMEIHLNKDGEGEGRMAYMTKISFDKKKNQVELENYSSEPVRLNNIKATKG